MNFFDGWKTLNSRFDESNLTALTQLVGYKLFAVDNELKFPDSFLLTDRELMSRTNIKSGRTIVEARRQLKNAGLIDFTTEKARPTRYSFTLENREVSKQEARSKQASRLSTSFDLTPQEDVKTLDGETDSIQYNRARDTQNEIDSLISKWEKAGGSRLNQLLIAKLNALLEKNTLAELEAAIDLANDGTNDPRYGFSLNYVKLKLAEVKKAGEKVEHRGAKPNRATDAGGGYEIPVERDDDPWAKY